MPARTTSLSDTALGVRETAMRSGLLGLSDADVLTLFLGRAMPRGAGTMAKVLLAQFGSLEAVLTAPAASLVSVVGQVGIELKLVHELNRRLLEPPLRRRSVLGSWSALLDYVRLEMAARNREQFRVLFLDKKNQLLADEVMNEGTVDHAPVYPREIVRRALELSVSALILVHNHPSGDPTPSTADVNMTRQVVEACKALNICVHDHLVVGAQGVASMKALGLM